MRPLLRKRREISRVPTASDSQISSAPMTFTVMSGELEHIISTCFILVLCLPRSLSLFFYFDVFTMNSSFLS